MDKSQALEKLQKRFDELNSEGAKFISLEQLDPDLEAAISIYEKRI